MRRCEGEEYGFGHELLLAQLRARERQALSLRNVK